MTIYVHAIFHISKIVNKVRNQTRDNSFHNRYHNLMGLGRKKTLVDYYSVLMVNEKNVYVIFRNLAKGNPNISKYIEC